MNWRRFAFAALAVFASCEASAFHIQIGASGWSRRAEQWIDGSVEIGAAAGALSGQVCAAYGWTDYGNQYYYIPLGCKMITTSSSTWTESCYVRFIPGGGLSLYAATTSPDYTEMYGAKRFVAAESVSLGTFGYGNAYQRYQWDNAVITVRGDPYSTVVNDTDTDRTVNGVLIRAGDGEALPFPIYLVMDEVENIKFYDLESGDEITPRTYKMYYDDPGSYYHRDGYYCPSWTGNIRFSDGTSKSGAYPPVEPLVFGDMVAANEGKILHAQNGMPLYADGKVVATNINLETWWDFDQSAWGGSPQAMINGVVVCPGHSTSHIIDYTVSTEGMKVYGGVGYVDFTMSQTPQSGYGGGSCVMRCWDKETGSSTSAYANTPSAHKAEVSAGLGVARFRVRVNTKTGEWSVYPL